MPILGVIASSISGNLYSASYDSIATVTVGAGGSAFVEFTSIPSTYTHLQIRMLTRDTRAGSVLNNANAIFNSDTSSNYTDHYILGNGSIVAAGGSGNGTVATVGLSASSTSPANVYGSAIIDILDYANTNKFKTVRSYHGYETGSSGGVRLRSSVWRSTNAITSIKISPDSSGNFVQYSSFGLYGLKVA